MAGLLTEKIRASQKKRGLLDLWSGLLAETGLPELFSGKIDGQTLEQGIQNRLQPNSLRPALSPQQMVEAGLNIAGVAPIGATVWHGSPHKFDKFDMSAPKTTSGGFNDSGISVSPSESVAKRYAEDFSIGGRGNGYLYKVDIPDDAKTLALESRDFHYLQERVNDLRNGKILTESQSVGVEQIMKKYGIEWDWNANQNPINAIKNAGYNIISNRVPGGTRSGLSEAEMLVMNPELTRILERNGEPTGLLPWAPGEANKLLGIIKNQTNPTNQLNHALTNRPRNALGQEIPPTQYELAHQTAQRNAALPVEQGGLGLPPNNTAMDRAAAQNYIESGFTGTHRDITEYDPNKRGAGGSGSREGPLGAWLTDDPRVAGEFANFSSRNQGGDVIYPLMIRGDKPFEATKYSDIKDVTDAHTKFIRPPYRMIQDEIDYPGAREQLKTMGDYVALRNTKTDSIDNPITQFLVADPARLRSRFAAFDPMKRDSADLLAGIAPYALPISAGLLGSMFLFPED